MQTMPPIDPAEHQLAPLLAAAGRTVDWLNTDDGDPHGPANVARHCLIRTYQQVPHHYRHAVASLPELHTWITGLADGARRHQAKHNTAVAGVLRGPSMLILGPTGVGKTHQAYGALRLLAVSGVMTDWTVATAADMYAEMRPRHNVDSEQVYRRYRDARLLLIDDLGAGRAPTEFTEEINFRLVNHRYERHLPTLFTTNVLPGELKTRLGDRVASRLREMCQRVTIKGDDRRRGEAA